MQYKDLIQFEAIPSVIKLTDADDDTIAKQLVATYVFSKKIKEDITKIIVRNLNTKTNDETKGLQIVGSYGTGKSHLMILISSIAEDASLLSSVSDEAVRETLRPIAGKYKSLRFEIGNTNVLQQIVFDRIETYLAEQNIDFQFDKTSTRSFKEQLQQMMAAFEAVYPDKYFLVAIDELLEYLKSRDSIKLNEDLMFLRQMGEMCDRSRFRMMYGVQELIYRAPEFQFATEMLGKIKDRSDDIIITKEDVAFVVKERLLKKTAEQKVIIKKHLEKFTHLFEHLANNLNDYVEMFPVHPRYITHFEQIRLGKNQREILKVLTSRFQDILNNDVPTDAPGLITYDTYWQSILSDASMSSEPDVRAVRDVANNITEKIGNYFVKAKENRKTLAQAIANALSINILADGLQKKNGAAAKELRDDLCIMLPNVNDATMLLSMVSLIAKDLVTATSGQYIDINTNNDEFHIRTEGGRNFDQDIKNHAENVVKRTTDTANQVFFDFLAYVLQLDQSLAHKTGFKIWRESLTWVEKKSFREGYVFFGNPGDKSTTHPILHYYSCFSPIFGGAKFTNEADEVYFDLSKLNDEFKENLYLYGAAKSLAASSPSNQQDIFKQKIKDCLDICINLFNKQVIDAVQVVYRNETKSLRSYALPPEGTPIRQVFSDVSARVFDSYFSSTFPDYPAFKDLNQPMSKDNYTTLLQATFAKIVNPNNSNRNGEAILSGLGLWSGANMDIQNSRYAKSVLSLLDKKGVGQVLNKDEILECTDAQYNIWYSRDFRLDDGLEFVVLTALVQMGKIELNTGAMLINATNIQEIAKLSAVDYYMFRHVAMPKNANLPALKALFRNLKMDDYTLGNGLDNGQMYGELKEKALILAEKIAKTMPIIANGISCRTLSLLDDNQKQQYKSELSALQSVAENISTYNNKGKISNFQLSEEELNQVFKAEQRIAEIETMQARAAKFNDLAIYLSSAASYLGASQATLKANIERTLQQELPTKLAVGNDTELRQFEAALNAYKDEYANYYLAQYQKYLLTPDNFNKKISLAQSENKSLCNALKDITFINASEFDAWCDTMDKLKAQDVSLSLANIKLSPYHGFNPKEKEGLPHPSISRLSEQLDTTLETYQGAIYTFLKDPSIQQNAKSLLKAKDFDFISAFWIEKTSITSENAAELVRSVNILSKNIEIIEINVADLQKILGQPIAPEEAIAQFNQLIDQLCAGKKRDEVRVVLI